MIGVDQLDHKKTPKLEKAKTQSKLKIKIFPFEFVLSFGVFESLSFTELDYTNTSTLSHG
jgi:hypothetical protein